MFAAFFLLYNFTFFSTNKGISLFCTYIIMFQAIVCSINMPKKKLLTDEQQVSLSRPQRNTVIIDFCPNMYVVYNYF